MMSNEPWPRAILEAIDAVADRLLAENVSDADTARIRRELEISVRLKGRDLDLATMRVENQLVPGFHERMD